MRMYAASLADYNAGRLHGTWIDLEGKDLGDIEAEIAGMLAESRELVAEEWAAHDWDGMPASYFGEYPDLEEVAAFVALCEEYDYLDDAADVIGEYIDGYGTLEDFADRFSGVWDTEEEFAEDFADNIGAIDGNTSWPYTCIDWERAASELFMDYSSVRVSAGIAVFSP